MSPATLVSCGPLLRQAPLSVALPLRRVVTRVLRPCRLAAAQLVTEGNAEGHWRRGVWHRMPRAPGPKLGGLLEGQPNQMAGSERHPAWLGFGRRHQTPSLPASHSAPGEGSLPSPRGRAQAPFLPPRAKAGTAFGVGAVPFGVRAPPPGLR